MTVLDSTIVNVAPDAGGIQVKHQHPAGGRAGVIDRHVHG